MDKAELRYEVFTRFKVMPAFIFIWCPWAWMSVWRIHPQTTKTRKENHEDRDCVHRQQEEAVFCHHWESTAKGDPQVSPGWRSVCSPCSPISVLCNTKGTVWFGAYLFQQQITAKGRSANDVQCTFCNILYPETCILSLRLMLHWLLYWANPSLWWSFMWGKGTCKPSPQASV